MANTEILAAIKEFQSKIEGQILATNATLKEFMSSFDSRFADLPSTPSPSPATAFSPLFRSGGGYSAPRQRWLPNAPLQPPGSAAPPPKPAPEPTAILTALLEKAGCKASDSLSTFAPNDEASKDVDSPDLCKLSNAEVVPFLSFNVTSAAASSSIAAVTTSAAASTSFSAAPPPFLSSDDTTTLYQTTNNADCVPTVPTAILAAPPAAMLPVEFFGTAPSPVPGPAREFTPPPPPTAPSASPFPTKAALVLFPPQATTISFSHFQVLGHRTKVGQILKNILWPSPSDMEAQSNPFNKYHDDAAVASRRGVIFSLYALEEVYKDIFESPP